MKRILLILTMGVALILLPEQATAQSPKDIADGARVWANNCTRCHNARSPMERTDRQWVTIIAHMRARANLTRSEAHAVSAYLQAINTPEIVAPQTPTPTTPPVETRSESKEPGEVQQDKRNNQSFPGEAETKAVLQIIQTLQKL